MTQNCTCWPMQFSQLWQWLVLSTLNSGKIPAEVSWHQLSLLCQLINLEFDKWPLLFLCVQPVRNEERASRTWKIKLIHFGHLEITICSHLLSSSEFGMCWKHKWMAFWFFVLIKHFEIYQGHQCHLEACFQSFSPRMDEEEKQSHWPSWSAACKKWRAKFSSFQNESHMQAMCQVEGGTQQLLAKKLDNDPICGSLLLWSMNMKQSIEIKCQTNPFGCVFQSRQQGQQQFCPCAPVQCLSPASIFCVAVRPCAVKNRVQRSQRQG